MGKRTICEIAQDYFDYLGRNLPHQCASDEFYFFPRSAQAIRHLAHLDDINPERVQDYISYVQSLLNEISVEDEETLEDEIDRSLVKQSMKCFIREFGDAGVWRKDPTLYVKIPLLATDHIISSKYSAPGRVKDNLLRLFPQIPPFLERAAKNLYTPSELSLEIALAMIGDAVHFYKGDFSAFVLKTLGGDKELLAQNEKVLDAWEEYRRALMQISPEETFAIGDEGLEAIFTISLGYPKTSSEILEVAEGEYRKTREELCALAASVDSKKTWHDIIHREISRSASSPSALMGLYRKEVKKLRRFLYSRDIITFPPGEEVMVLQTPSYLKSLRAAASYRAPLTGEEGEGIFYITPGDKDLKHVAAHCPYLSAHETYPGHHILDHIRIHHPNPIRRQIESALFYEGWACYAEYLLDELGYIENESKRLIGLKRRLWRNLRAELDVKLQTGRITLAEGAKKLEELGFLPGRAARQIRRFALSPGYQSCYAMGLHEMLGLRRQFSLHMTLKEFHDILLAGGQIPFHYCEKRLRRAVLHGDRCE